VLNTKFDDDNVFKRLVTYEKELHLWHGRGTTGLPQERRSGTTREPHVGAVGYPQLSPIHATAIPHGQPHPDHSLNTSSTQRGRCGTTRRPHVRPTGRPAGPGCPSGATHCSIAFNTCAVVATRPRGCRRLCGPFVADRSAPHGQPHRDHTRATTNSWPGGSSSSSSASIRHSSV